MCVQPAPWTMYPFPASSALHIVGDHRVRPQGLHALDIGFLIDSPYMDPDPPGVTAPDHIGIYDTGPVCSHVRICDPHMLCGRVRICDPCMICSHIRIRHVPQGWMDRIDPVSGPIVRDAYKPVGIQERDPGRRQQLLDLHHGMMVKGGIDDPVCQPLFLGKL